MTMGLFERLREKRSDEKELWRPDETDCCLTTEDRGIFAHCEIGTDVVLASLIAAEHNAMGPILNVLDLFVTAEGLGSLGAAYEALHRLETSQADVTGTVQ